LIRLKDYEAAKKEADKIPMRGVSDLCHMRLLGRRGEHAAIVEQYGDANIEEWPPMWRGHGYVLRGNAANRAGRGELAASDLEEAALYAATFRNPSNDKARLLNTLGQTYRDLLKDDERAIDAFQRAQAVGSSSKGTSATFALADIYLKRDEPDKAVAVVKEWIEEVKPQNAGSAYWQKYLLSGTVRVFAAAGRKDEAMATCKEALAMDGILPEVKEAIQKQLGGLQAESATAGASD
jgi:tetratricopeptide (TPR) repeat protein